jgi:nucleoside-diphosphate-sugar epimerase
MKVLITGGLGFVGLQLARALLAKGTLHGVSGGQEPIDTITLFDQALPETQPAGLDHRVSITAGDIGDRDTVFGLVDRDDISVFHLASVLSGGGERDFDGALRVNLDGGRHLFDAVRARAGLQRVVFASSIAVFGGSVMPTIVTDETKQTSTTTYGITKTICELLINDYSRKGFFDGRTARLPTIFIRPGKPNSAASSFCSGVFREPLAGAECVLPVARARLPMLGYRRGVAGFVALHEAPAAALGDDRAVNLPSRAYTVDDMVAAVTRVAKRHGIALGPILTRPDPVVQRIVDGWATDAAWDRARALGLQVDARIDDVVDEYIEDFLRPAARAT